MILLGILLLEQKLDMILMIESKNILVIEIKLLKKH